MTLILRLTLAVAVRPRSSERRSRCQHPQQTAAAAASAESPRRISSPIGGAFLSPRRSARPAAPLALRVVGHLVAELGNSCPDCPLGKMPNNCLDGVGVRVQECPQRRAWVTVAVAVPGRVPHIAIVLQILQPQPGPDVVELGVRHHLPHILSGAEQASGFYNLMRGRPGRSGAQAA